MFVFDKIITVRENEVHLVNYHRNGINIKLLLIITALILMTGCATRSISNSGYPAPSYYGYKPDNPLYKGELSEFDVLGIEAGANISDEEITKAFAKAPTRKMMKKGDRILLIQSGAMIPDEDMVNDMDKYFSISVFTGVPEKNKANNASYSKSLRLAAAKAGIETIVAYWGVLESGTKNLDSKVISWVPLIGSIVPDEKQVMRIRLKVAVIDVRTGLWEVFSPKGLGDEAYSGRINREHSDQKQVAKLKQEAYKLAADGIAARFIK